MNHQPECRHLLASLSYFVDGALEDAICTEIERHLADCQNCRIVVDTLERTIYLYHTTSQGSSVPPEVRQRLFRRLEIEDLLDQQSETQ